MNRERAQLELVLKLRSEEERQAGEALRAAQSLLAEEEQRLAALDGYAQDYHGSHANGVRDPRSLRETRLFLSQLARTVELQTQQVSRAREAVERARLRWLYARMQREAIARLADRRRGEQRRGEARAEQRQQDELSLVPRLASGTVH